MLRCTFDDCQHQEYDSKSLIEHVGTKHFYRRNEKIKCFYKDCHAYYSNLKILSNHIKSKHEKKNLLGDYFLCCNIKNCLKKWIENLDNLIIHYYTHFRDETKLKCLFESCSFESTSKNSYKSHLSRSHPKKSYQNLKKELIMNNVNFNEFVNEVSTQNACPEDNHFLDTNTHQNKSLNTSQNESLVGVDERLLQTNKALREFTYNCYLKYHDKFLIPNTQCNEIFHDMSTILSLNQRIIEDVSSVIAKNLDAKESNMLKTISNFVKNNNDFLSLNRNLTLWSNSSKTFREKYYVEPVQIELNYNEISYKYHYIPINRTLQAMMNHQQIFKLFFEHKKLYKDEIESFSDSFKFQQNKLYRNSKQAFQVILYLDEFETSNPLGDTRKKYKMYAVYFKIGNLAYQYQSKSHFIQLAMLFNSELLKLFSFDRILDPLIKDLKILENYGIDLDDHNGNLINLKGTICFIVADNLAANGIGGFTESFGSRVEQFCRFCTATRIDVQTNVYDKDCEKRTKLNYQNSVKNLYETNKKFDDGIKRDSCLNQLSFFHVVDGLAPDIMHDLLEGVIPLNFQLLMRQIFNEKLYSNIQFYEELNKFQYGRIDGKSKVPAHLFANNPFQTGNSITMSAKHMWTLVRIFPLIVGEKLKDNFYYLHFLKLIEIFKNLNNNHFSENSIIALEDSIASYLTEFKLLYPAQNITPKQHFLIHYGRAIRTFGPPKFFSTMRFEAKHSYFKKVNQATHNHINLTYSLTIRHQRLQLYHLSSHNYFVSIEYGNIQKINPDLLEFIKLITDDNNVNVYNSIELNSICYKIDDIVIKSVVNSIPIFSKIKSIAKTKTSQALFIVHDLKTKGFCRYKMGYILESIESVYLPIESHLLINPFPMDLYNLNDKNGQQIVVPKYPFV